MRLSVASYDALSRARAADVRAGLVSISAARTLYAVAVDDAGRLDESATARLRGTA